MKLLPLIASVALGGAVATGTAIVIMDEGETSIPSPAPTEVGAPSPARGEENKVEAKGKTLSGTYYCWSYNVDGYGAKCTSSKFEFKTDGTYTFSSESGTYTVSGNTVTLSASKIRGPGTLLENDMQIRFEYEYNGKHHTVTYLKR